MVTRYTAHPAGGLLSGMLSEKHDVKKAPVVPEKTLDDIGVEDIPDLSDAGNYASANMALNVGSCLQEWAGTSAGDLDEGETLGNRLQALLVGVADDEQDGDIDDDEGAVLEMAANHAADYLAGKGVSDDDIGLLLNDWDEDAANRVQELLADKVPAEAEAAMDDLDDFAFGDDDGATLDAVYKQKMAVRHGRKVKIEKRISGKVRLSAKQKMGIRKAQRKAHSAAAQARRLKSLKIENRMQHKGEGEGGEKK